MRRWNLEKAREYFKSRNCELLETTYKNTHIKMRYLASCGHEHEISLDNFTKGKGDLCRACRYVTAGRKESLGMDRIKAFFEDAGCEVLNDDFYKNKDKVKYIAHCGHEASIDYNHFSSGGGRLCRKCSRSVRYEYDYVVEAFEQRGCVLLETEYVNCKEPMRYIATCGHESIITFDKLLNCEAAALRCRNCHKHTYHENPSPRDLYARKVFARGVFERDNWECVVCGKHGGDLNAHHLNAHDWASDQRFSISNGVTMCSKCHTQFHRAYGFGGNTAEQFNEWFREYRGKLSDNTDDHRNA